MKRHLRILIWMVTLLCGVSVQAATRVALVSTCGGDAEADVLALAEAKLSQQPGIELVERREVERVLQEQKLVKSYLRDSNQTITFCMGRDKQGEMLPPTLPILTLQRARQPLSTTFFFLPLIRILNSIVGDQWGRNSL